MRFFTSAFEKNTVARTITTACCVCVQSHMCAKECPWTGYSSNTSGSSEGDAESLHIHTSRGSSYPSKNAFDLC